MKRYQLKKKQSIKRKKKSNNTNTEEIQSPKRFNPPSSHSTPKRGNLSFNDSFPVDVQSPKIIMSPDAQSTPLSPMSVSTSTSESSKPSTSYGSPKSQGSHNDPNMVAQFKHLSLSLDSATNFMIDNLTKDTIFKSYSPNILHEDQPGLDRIVIQTHTNTKNEKKI